MDYHDFNGDKDFNRDMDHDNIELGKYKDMRMKWQRAVQTLMDVTNQPIGPCGLAHKDWQQVPCEYCAFCAQKEPERWREFTDVDRRLPR